MLLPCLSFVVLLVLLTMTAKNVPCLLTFTIEFATISPGSWLRVLLSAAITWCGLEFNTCSLSITLHKQTFQDCDFIMGSVVNLAMEEI